VPEHRSSGRRRKDQDVDEGQPGELLIKGPSLPKDTTIGQKPTSNHSYGTGDIGTYQDGLVRIVDRKKELIKYKGQQVAPAELEALLLSHPRIADAAVIGVWNGERHTEVPRAYVVRHQFSGGRPITAQEVADFVRGRVATHKWLGGGVFFQDEVPKSVSGKMLRKELRLKASQALQAKL